MISGEQIAYTYDALNRLATAQTTQTGGTQWGQSYTYDGFGNLTDQTVIKGSAPDVHVAYNYLTNRQTGDTADANGNIGSGNIYDLENRLVQPSGSTARYGYDAGNKRVWRGDTGVDEIDFWGGKKLATYQIVTFSGYSTIYFGLTSTNVYFGSKLISKGTYNAWGTGDYVALAPVAADRLGSIGKFYPYGTERPSATGNDKEKFTGYFRDASTGLDYADQRYHQPGMGRFMTPDSAPSASASNPGSQNRYAYVEGDPVNRIDPTGQDSVLPDPGIGTSDGGDWNDGGDWSNGPWIDVASLDAAALAQGCQILALGFAKDGGWWNSNCGKPPVAPVAYTPCSVTLYGQPAFSELDPIDHTYIEVQYHGQTASQATFIEGIPVIKNPGSRFGRLPSPLNNLAPSWLNAVENQGHSTYPTTSTFLNSWLVDPSICDTLIAEASPGGYPNNYVTYNNRWPWNGPNSNSFTHTLLNSVGLGHVELSNILYAGWNTLLNVQF